MPEILPLPKRQSARFPFTSRRLADYPAPPAGRVELIDAGCPGLRLRITAGGVKTFAILRRVSGRLARYTIGRFPEVSIEGARKKARELAVLMVNGVDPRAARLEARAAASFGELGDAYLEHAKLRKRTWQQDANQLDRYLKAWNSRALASITREQVATLHAKMGRDHGLYAANRLLALISCMFGFAINRRGYKGENPARGVERYREEKRSRFVQPDEVPRLFAAIAEEPSATVRDFVLVSLYTGARRANVESMRWEQLDLDRGTWTIPRTKSGHAVTLPLSPEAVAVLRGRIPEGEWVFPARVGDGHLVNPGKAWRKIRERAGLPGLRLHDLRRTLGSWQAGAGVSLPIIGAALGHSSTASTAVYARLHLDPVREAVANATAAIAAAAKGGKQ